VTIINFEEVLKSILRSVFSSEFLQHILVPYCFSIFKFSITILSSLLILAVCQLSIKYDKIS